MKMLTLAAAAAAALAGLMPAGPAAAAPAPVPVMAAPAPAPVAAPQRYEERVVTRRTVVRRDRYRHRPRWSSRRVCRNEWRRGHRVRICRTVRYRR